MSVESLLKNSHLAFRGVPQGSILGPLLFSLYLDPLTKISLSQDTTVILYADDIVLYRPISSSHDIDIFQSDVDKIADWVKDAGLCLNANKSKVVVFSHKKSRPAVNIQVDDTAVPVADSTRFLGVTITSDLKWNTHISNTHRGVKDWVHMKTAKMMQYFNCFCNLDVSHKRLLILIIKVVYLCTLHNKMISPAHFVVYMFWRPTPTWFSNKNAKCGIFPADECRLSHRRGKVLGWFS